MFKGKAALKRNKVHFSQQRQFCGIPVSTVALGTYLGNMDEVTDMRVTKACVQAVEQGCNFFDTAINYRGQRAERSIGEAIRQLILSGKAKREEIFVSSKAGFLPYDGQVRQDLVQLFREKYVSQGLVKESDLVAGCHCIEPAYLVDQLDQSRKNLQLETIDLYYLHNPETQLEELPSRIFYEKLGKAFQTLEKAVSEGKISAYGMATWSAFRDEPGSQTAVSLEKCVEVAGPNFKAIQLPLNLAMHEAASVASQTVNGQPMSAIEAAKTLGLDIAVSVPLFQGRLCHGLPDFILQKFPQDLSQAHCAMAFALSFEEISAIMVGMKSPEHVSHNLEFLHTDLRTMTANLAAPAVGSSCSASHPPVENE